jgi:hypothetical protein
MMFRKILLLLVALILISATVFVVKMGPRNVIGMIRYDQRREGDLKVGDRAPGAMLASLDGRSQVPLFVAKAETPTVLIFGSFT